MAHDDGSSEMVIQRTERAVLMQMAHRAVLMLTSHRFGPFILLHGAKIDNAVHTHRYQVLQWRERRR